MTPPLKLRTALCAILLIGCDSRKAMSTDLFEIKLAVSRIANTAEVTSARLVNHNGAIAAAVLAKGQDGSPSLFLVQPDGSGSPQGVFRLSSPFGIPAWDIAASNTSLAAIWTKPGSAISPLVFQPSTSANPAELTAAYSMGVFQSPRFAKRATSIAITALASQENGKTVVALFRDQLNQPKPRYQPLPPTGDGLLADALLIRMQPGGWLLLTKHIPPGPRGSERATKAGESLIPGVVRSLRLSETFAPEGPIEQPLGDTRILEFDADLNETRAFVVATTATGVAGSIGTVAQKSVAWAPLVQFPSQAELLSPSLHAGDARSAWISMLENRAADTKPNILMGQIRLTK